MLGLAVPVVVVQVGLMLMGVVDTIIVGHVSAAALAAVALGNLYFFAAVVFGMGTLMALDPLVAQAVGAGDEIAVARAVQRGMVSQMGLQDLGVNYDNLAVVRGTWYPAVLCEGAFIILPDQEAALRTPEFQERYARGVADGLENYFRTLGTR